MFGLKRNYFKTSSIKLPLSRGFTLVELLVTISVFVLLTGVVLFNQSKFNSSILLTNLAYDTALTIRQAQTYGINVKEFNNSLGVSQFVPYGVHFEKANPKSFILFADIDYDTSSRISDGVFATDGDPTRCRIEDGCVSRYNIQRGNYIKDLCLADVTVFNGTCPGNTSVNTLNIVFTRPNPDAQIREKINSAEVPDATIIISGSDNASYRYVHVMKNGLIEIKH